MLKNFRLSKPLRIVAGLLTLAVGLSLPAQADDRDLLRASSVKPYVFVILDTSGSMNLSPPCSAADFGAGICGFRCPGGDCFVPRNADDPASKFRQAREALSEVIDGTKDVYWGFASYNQDDVNVSNKHWLYTVSTTQPAGFFSLPPSSPPANSWTQYPKAGAEEVFGATITCNSVNNTGCAANSVATLPNFSAAPNYALEKVRRYPKGASNADTVTYFVQDNNVATLSGYNKIFRVTYQLTGGSTLGNATVQANVSISRCKNTTCAAASDYTALAGSPKAINFDLVGDFLMVDSGSGSNTKPSGVTTNYFSAEDISVGNTCSGWEPNTDSSADDNGTYNLKITTTGTAPRDYGDVTPLDWDFDNKAKVRSRLAPDGTAANSGESYTSSQYFRNTRSGSETFLRLLDDTRHTLVSNGSTPIGTSMNDFRLWYTGSRTGTTSKTGWRGAAIANDKNWTCRKVYLIFITDGMDTCGGKDPCQEAADLKSGYDTKTYAIAFGQTSNANVTCMADKGGTGLPIFPTNKKALVDALNGILTSIREDSAAFASAAVPSVQAQVADKVYLTNFSPVNPDDPLKPPPTNSPTNASSIWVGHIQAYLKPLPVDPLTGLVSDTLCTSGQKSRCLAWDSFTAMKTQAPTQLTIATDKQVGPRAQDRRIYYSDGGAITTGGAVNTQVPLTRKLFLPPAVADRLDLWQGMGIANSGSGDATALATSNAVIDFTLEQKHTQIVREIPIAGHPNPEDVDYILGDIFHSNPVVLNNPSNLRYFMRDIGRGAADSNDCTATTNPNHGYQCFFERHRCRRRMLFVGSNDGQLHAIDAGIFSVADPNNHNLLQCNDLTLANINTTLQEPIGFFDNGTGKEIFSYIPRPALAKLKQYKDTGRQDWSVDGTPVADDVFIDPAHSGTPAAADREWRTVLVGGMREGGNTYFALDVTQPDTYNSFQVPQPSNTYVPSCLSAGTSGCATAGFPSPLWEFSDLNDEDVDGQPGSTHPDLAKTWSTPNMGRIRVCEGVNCDPNSPTNNLVDKYVAVFGGGVDGSADTTSPNFSRYGNWLYMVDIETGRAIYKRQLDGAAPSEPAAVDVNQDGYLDTIYIGTTTGYMYKVDLTTVPQLLNQTVSYWSCTTDPCATGSPKPAPITRTEKRIVDTAWTPFKIFNTGGRPIYYPPTVVFVGQLGQYALGFGTGNRENLWAADALAGRFYMITDTGFTRAMALSGTLPLVETSYPLLNPASGAAPRDFIINPDTASGMRSGWVMQLDVNERVISNAFSLSGITVFTGYTPTTGIDPALGNLCSKGGDSRIFTVMTTTADAVMKSGNNPIRFVLKDNFVTNPFTEQSQTKNASASDQQGQQLTSDQQELFDKLKTLFPQNCKFSNFRVDIKTVRADTKLVLIAPVPVCIVQKNWKEY